MKYSRSIIEIIKDRSSRRSYTPQPVEAEKLGALSDFFAALAGPFGGKARFLILDTTGWGERKINALGTYGTMQGARLFIVGIIRRGEHDMEDFGYQFEKIILRATDLGLGTCWIGGIFNRSLFADKAGVREDEVLPAISPLGYPPTGDGLLGRVAKLGCGTLVAGRPDMGDFGGTRQWRKVILTYVLTLLHTIAQYASVLWHFFELFSCQKVPP